MTRSWLIAFAVVLAASGCSGLTLTSVEPAEVAAGATLEVRGLGFDDTLQLRLESAAGVDVTLGLAARGVDSASATVPSATPAGLYDLVGTTSGGETRLAGAVTIVVGRLRVLFLDVGQGDSALVIGPDGSTLLIDGGPRSAGDVVIDAVANVAGGRLDAVALTHAHEDHMGGLVALLRGDDGEAGSPDDLVPQTRWQGHDDADCDSQICAELRALRARFERPLIGDTLSLGGAVVTVMGRDGDVGQGRLDNVDDPNERSLALLIEFAGRRVFIGGDLTGGGLGDVDLEAGLGEQLGPVDVMKLNHHGSLTSTSTGFLDALQPRAAVISLGTDNPFCHPARDVLDRLIDRGIPPFATGLGMVDDLDGCDEVTAWPADARTGLGTIELVVDAAGTMTLAGEPL